MKKFSTREFFCALMYIEGGVIMKKVLLSMMLCFLLVGCGNKLVCTASSDKMDSKVTFTIKDGKAASLKEEYKFNDKETADAFCSLIKLGKSSADLNDMKISCKSKKVSVSSKNVEDYYETTDIDEITESLEDKGFTCE